MLTKRSNHKKSSLSEKTEHIMMHDTDEEDETLSLCDLPIYSNEEEKEWSSKEFHSGSSSSSSDEDDYFEFFRAELDNLPHTASVDYPLQDVIFCGKVLVPREKTTAQKVGKSRGLRMKKPGGVLRLVSELFRGENGSKTRRGHRGGMCVKEGKKNDGKANSGVVSKMTILTKPTGKPRWFVLLFGMGKLPGKMELRDKRNRQSRRQQPSLMMSPPPRTPGQEGGDGAVRVLIRA